MIKLTPEQLRIARAEPTDESPVKINAFAGTGKTTMLRAYAAARPEKSMLYVAFNRITAMSMREKESRRKSNIQARTIHSLALGAMNEKYSHKIFHDNISAHELMKKFSISSPKKAHLVKMALQVFLSSADGKPSKQHVSIDMPRSISQDQEKWDDIRKSIADHVSDVWDAMKAINNDFKLTDDGYLKLYQLSDPVLSQDYILLDEAQDTTPCVWDILQRQKSKKVLVGDEHQAIYGWRGAVDFLSNAHSAPELTFPLRTSFRFGNELAEMANSFLYHAKGVDVKLRGNPNIQTQILTIDNNESIKTIIDSKNIDILTNAYRKALQGKRIGFEGGIGCYRAGDLVDIANLFLGNEENVKNPEIKMFGDYDKYKEFLTDIGDYSMLSVCRFAEEHRSNVFNVIKVLKSAEVKKWETPEIVYSTVHKAKGLEWPMVEMGYGMENLVNSVCGDDSYLSFEEANCIYVGLTRGINKVICPLPLMDFIKNGYKVMGRKVELAVEEFNKLNIREVLSGSSKKKILKRGKEWIN